MFSINSTGHSSNGTVLSYDFMPQNFRKLLLHKCQDEFENRRRATAAFTSRRGVLSPEEEEQMGVAKRKMLGNIKFVGE